MSGMDDQTLLEIVERVRGRFFGKYRGTVTEVDDDTLRIKAKVPAVLGGVKSGWCMPCVPYAGKEVGIAFLPEVGSGVWIEFEGGDVSYPIWVGCYWRSGEKPSDATGKVKTIVSNAKHKILLDDDQGSITIQDNNENKITMNSSGITLERSGKKVEVTSSKVSVNDGALEVT
jgi:uncharacterized protein involved in type VI secretion and phage assembly